MESSAEEYAAFEEKVRRTIYIDNLSPDVKTSVLVAAFDQFGNVKNVQFIPTYLESFSIHAALVEMESVKQAETIISNLNDTPFMINGMPRPVRARKARIEMFDDRPRKPGRTIVCKWLDSSDPNFEVATKIKELTKKHASEASFLLQQQLEEEEKLHNLQAENLKANFKKYDLIDSTYGDGIIRRVAAHYGTKLIDG